MKIGKTNRAVGSALLLAVLAGTPAAVFGDDAVLTVGPAGTSVLSFGAGEPFHTTAAVVKNLRTIAVPGSPAVFAVWDEEQGGEVRHYYAYSADGVRMTHRVRQTEYVVRVRYANFDPAVSTPAIPRGLEAPAGSELHLVQFWVPPIAEFQAQIESLGGEVYRTMSDHTLIVRMSEAVRAEVERLGAVRWVGSFHPAYKLYPDTLAALVGGGAESLSGEYSFEVFKRGLEQQVVIADLLRGQGVPVDVTTPEGFRMQAHLTPEHLMQLIRRDEIHYVDPWGPGETDMDIVREIGGANFIESTLGFTGQGVRGEIFDTGINLNHVDFQSPQQPMLHGPASLDSHGNACYGINFGTGTGNPMARGLMPDNEQGYFALYSQVTQFGGSKTRHSLTDETVNQQHCVFQTSSVGSPRTTVYTTISAETDDYLFIYQLLSTQSQSNAGNQDSRPQAWAKNIVAVGGYYHQNTLTRADDAWSFGASIGPAEDGRIKPDLSNFYDATTTTYSTSTTGYGTFGGTSNATPITAGHFGLMFQMWHEGVFPNAGGGMSVFEDRPKMATAKAIMINTAHRYDWTMGGPNGDMDRFKQGWGSAQLENLYNARTKFNFIDETEVIKPFETKVFFYDVPPGEPQLNVTLCYVDPMGTTSSSQHRINDLSLRVSSPTGQVYWGNNGLTSGNWSLPGGVSNTKDTVENVFVQNPAAGQWVVEVIGDEIVQDAHVETTEVDADFALVVTGATGAPAGLFISLASAIPPLVAPNTPLDVQFKIDPGGDTIVPGSEQFFYRTTGSGSFISTPLTPIGGNLYEATFPGVDCNAVPEFYAQVEGQTTGVKTSPANAPTNVYTFEVGQLSPTIVLDEDFEGGLPAGWTATGLWGVGSGVCPASNSPCAGPNYAYYTQPGTCTYNTGAANSGSLTSGPINIPPTPGGTVELEFCYNLQTEDLSPYDAAEVRVNGTTIAELADTEQWVTQTLNLDQYAGQTVTLEFFFDTVDGLFNDNRGWQIDGVKITATTVTCESCYADCDGDGTLTLFDFLCFTNEFNQGSSYADCNGDGTLNLFDFLCFTNEFNAGCP